MTLNHIILDANNVGSFLGPIASRYSYTPALRGILDGLYQTAKSSNNKYFVLEGEILRAAQSTKTGALQYMDDDKVLVEVSIPEITPEQLEQAKQMWSYFPFRKCFVALKNGEQMQVILKPTAHYAGKLARSGWTVRELFRS